MPESQSSVFKIDTFVVQGQHIREYPRGTAHRDETLEIEIKRYQPLDYKPQDGDVTLIGEHANGFPKELYEPLWEEIYRRLRQAGMGLRAVWMADVASQGASGIRNEFKLGNDPSGFDHPRDMLHIINHFRDEMPAPLVGLGHSMGACHLAHLSLMHPRLLYSIMMIEPIIGVYTSTNRPAGASPSPAVMTTFRKDVWPSRAEAENVFRRNKFYQTWNPAVFDRWLRHGLRDTPSAIHPSGETPSGAVTLATTKHQEAFMYSRPMYDVVIDEKGDDVAVDWSSAPDIDLDLQFTMKNGKKMQRRPTFYRPEAAIVYRNLPHLRPSVLYIFGGESLSSLPENCERKMKLTGTGAGGSGGREKGRVKQIRVEGGGHLLPMERVEEMAEYCVDWLGGEVARWKEEQEAYMKWEKLGIKEKTTMDSFWLESMALEGGPKFKIRTKI